MAGGMEAVISNVKRDLSCFDVVEEPGHFDQGITGVIAYNMQVMTNIMLAS
jgi:hypothetical protein